MKPYKDDEYYPVRATGLDIKWVDVFGYKIDGTILQLLGVQFTKTIYPFKDKRYVHNVKRDKDGDVCVVDQYGIDYKLFDVEFYISDEHDDTLVYEKYVKYVGGI